MDSTINNPHARFIRESLSNVAVAKDLLKRHLAPDVVKLINWDTLQATNKSFVDQKLTNIHTDVVFKFLLEGTDAYLYTLVEHSTTPERMLAFWLLKYNVLLMEQYLNEGNTKLPIILNVFIYAGAISPYPYSNDIYDCFDNPELARGKMPLRA
jgi:predicted transposase/invertase (TIGR01784 family)